jgi:hypothetical protein
MKSKDYLQIAPRVIAVKNVHKPSSAKSERKSL